METTFILHGGFNPDRTDDDEDKVGFYEEVLKHAPEGTKVLLVPFTKNPERKAQAVEKVASFFNETKWQKNIETKEATEEGFVEQIKWADVVYFFGGASVELFEILKRYPDLKETIRGKIIAGESAGANVWATFFYSPRSDTVSSGLGVLPIKMIPHYRDEYAGKLDDVGPGLEELRLPEYFYKVLRVTI